MKPHDIRNALRILHEKEGRDAAILKLDRGMCPYHFDPDKSDWERGFDSLTVPSHAYDSDYASPRQYPYY